MKSAFRMPRTRITSCGGIRPPRSFAPAAMTAKKNAERAISRTAAHYRRRPEPRSAAGRTYSAMGHEPEGPWRTTKGGHARCGVHPVPPPRGPGRGEWGRRRAARAAGHPSGSSRSSRGSPRPRSARSSRTRGASSGSATEDGLNRYDGYGFTVFRNDPLDPDSLPDNGQLSFAEGRGDVLWIGTVDRGIARLDLSTLRFQRFLPDPQRPAGLPAGPVAAILEDRAGTLWAGVGGGGLAAPRPGRAPRFEALPARAGEARRASPRPSSSPSRRTRRARSGSGRSAEGVLKVDPRDGRVLDDLRPRPGEPCRARRTPSSQTSSSTGRAASGPPPERSRGSTRRRGEVKVFRNDPSDPASFPSRQARRLAEDAYGRIWIATENGLVRLDPETGVFTAFRNRPDDAVEPPIEPDDHRPRRPLRPPLGGPRRVRARGARPRGSPFRTFRHEPGRPDGMTAPIVRGVHEARDGTLWLGLSGGGLNALDPSTGQVRAYPGGTGAGRASRRTTSGTSTTDEEGIVWAATLGGGLNRVDPRTGDRPRLPRRARPPRRRSLPTSSASSSRAATARSGSARPAAGSAGSTGGRSGSTASGTTRRTRPRSRTTSSAPSTRARRGRSGPGPTAGSTDSTARRAASRASSTTPRAPRRPASPASTASGRRPTGSSGPGRPAASSGSTRATGAVTAVPPGRRAPERVGLLDPRGRRRLALGLDEPRPRARHPLRRTDGTPRSGRSTPSTDSRATSSTEARSTAAPRGRSGSGGSSA